LSLSSLVVERPIKSEAGSGETGPLVGRVPPNDLDAEATVLSAVLLSSEAFDEIQEILRPEYCYSNANRLILETVFELQASGRPVDMVAVAGRLRDRGKLPQVGGTPYIAQLVDATPAVAHVGAHALTIREKWRLRQLIQACQQFAAEGYGHPGEVQSFIDRAEQAVFDIARIPEGTTVVPIKSAIVDAFKVLSAASQHGGGISGVPSGFTELDRKTSGMHKGDLFVVAGRPGMGKTALVLNIAVNVARPRRVAVAELPDPFGEAPVETPGLGCAYFSLEMPKEQLAARLLASEARVDLSRIRSGQPKAEDWNRLTEAAARLGRMPIWIDDTPALSLLELRAKVRRLQAELKRGTSEQPSGEGLGLVVVDYLQLMQGRRDAPSREQEISELSRGLKQLAKEMQVPVMALSQLNRSVETRTAKDKRPQLSDLRESGAIEQDADTILFIYRDEYYFRDESVDRGIAEIIIAKQRNGPTGIVKTKFSSEYTRFDNLTRGEYEEFDDYADGPAAADGY
jgi:replicative DNA helicase